MNPNMKLQYQVLAALGLDGDDEILEDVSDDEFDEEVPEFAYPITILFAQRDGKAASGPPLVGLLRVCCVVLLLSHQPAGELLWPLLWPPLSFLPESPSVNSTRSATDLDLGVVVETHWLCRRDLPAIHV